MSITNANIITRIRASVSRSNSNGCTPPVEEAWFPLPPSITAFPVSPGVIDLPPVPAETINVEPIPAESAILPIDFDLDNPDVCALFTSILSESNDPVYARELEVQTLILPFNEIIVHTALLRAYLNLNRYYYSLKPRLQDAPLDLRVLYYITRLYKFKKTNINYDIVSQDAVTRKSWKLAAASGSLLMEFPNSAIRPIKLFGEAGLLALSFANASVGIPGTFSYGWESTLETGVGSASPVNVSYRRNIHLTVYPASILLANGARAGARFINLRWYVVNSVPAGNSILGMNIRLYHTTSTTANSAVNAVNGIKTTVYSDSSTTPFLKAESLGVLQVDFSTPFVWDGVNSLVVETCTSQNETNYTSRGSLRAIGTATVRRYNWTDSAGSSCSTTPSDTAQAYISTQMDYE